MKFIGVVLAPLLVACASIPPTGPSITVGSDRISLTAAVFEAVCLASAPDFASAPDLMARAGLTDNRSSGASYDETGRISAKVQTVAARGGITIDRCSVVYEQPDPTGIPSAIQAALEGRDLLSAPPGETLINSRRAVVWPITLDGWSGRVTWIPWQSRRLPGGLYMDIPNRNTATA